MVSLSLWVVVGNVYKIDVFLDIVPCLLFVSRIGCGSGCLLCDCCRVSPGIEALLSMCGPLDE